MHESAGFAGVEDFNFYQSGALLALNTFGPHLLACLVLPLVCVSAREAGASPAGSAGSGRRQNMLRATAKGSQETLTSKHSRRSLAIGDGRVLYKGNFSRAQGKVQNVVQQFRAPDTDPAAQKCPDDGCAQVTLSQTPPQSTFRHRFLIASVVSMSCRTLTAAAATASALIQRRHLMVWALFAPKFLFEAVTLLVCDVALVLVALAA